MKPLALANETGLKEEMTEANLTRRKAPRSFRREQLIEATISTLARRGMAQTTLGDVAREAGVSHGLINFHFQSKDRLLAETLAFMSDQHRDMWTAALAEAGPDPAARLNALILAELDAAQVSRESLTAWCVFWGEVHNRPLYLQQCGKNDRAHARAFEEACASLASEGGYGIDPLLAARILRVTIEGMVLEMMFSALDYSHEDARRTAFFCAATMFPRHFSAEGLIPR